MLRCKQLFLHMPFILKGYTIVTNTFREATGDFTAQVFVQQMC